MDNRECPKCKENNHDSTGDHLWLMQDGNRWCCNKEEYHLDGKVYYEDNNGEAIQEPDLSINALLATLADRGSPSTVPESPVSGSAEPVRDKYRGIEPATYKHFETEAEYKGTDIELLKHPLYETDTNRRITHKVRRLPKDFYAEKGTGKGTRVQLFGQSVAKSAKKLVITEGELDAMSAWQMFKQGKYTKNVEVVSLPLGANIKALLDNDKFLKNYKEIYVAVDQDTAGEKVSRDIASALPLAKFMTFSEKDANDMLTSGKEDDFINALFSAEVFRPESIVRISSILPDVLAKPVMGRDWPWPSLTSATYGRRDGEGMFVGAGVKCGKSEWINQVIAFDIQQGHPLGVIKFEEIPAMTAKRVAGKIDGIFYHKPGVVYKDADLEATVKTFESTLILHQAFGTANWDTVKDFIRYCVFSGCKTIIIDPITKITNGLTPSETETELRRFSDELACMAQDLGFFYIVTCHLKAPNSGPSHERGGHVETYQFRGSRAMAENCYYFLGIERNKDPNLPEDDRNTSTFVLLEDRAFGNVCKFIVKYDKTNQSYLEPGFTSAF